MRSPGKQGGGPLEKLGQLFFSNGWQLCMLLICVLGCAITAEIAASQDKPASEKSALGRPTIVVETFAASTEMAWPYDWKQLQAETIAELKAKDGQKFSIGTEEPAGGASFYRLQGEVTEWHPGNRAKRMLVGMGSGRETAKIHYWLVAQTGKKVFEHTDIIRAEFWGNAYEGSVGQLAHPFADKIAKRLSEAKVE